jgi:hypothetical protein
MELTPLMTGNVVMRGLNRGLWRGGGGSVSA